MCDYWSMMTHLRSCTENCLNPVRGGQFCSMRTTMGNRSTRRSGRRRPFSRFCGRHPWSATAGLLPRLNPASLSIPSGESTREEQATTRRPSRRSRPLSMLLGARVLSPLLNVKFLFEGEEEAGSTHLEQIIGKHKDLLKSDIWLICDGPVHQSRAAQIAFGARGVVTLTLTVYGARRELHSGHYGNWSPNPAMMLAKLLASMKDDNGRILIEGFYEGVEPLSALEKQAIAEMPAYDDQLKKELWLGRTEGGKRRLAELISLPSLNIRGMSSARTGESATNVIPSAAVASLDIRLVKGLTAKQAIDRLRAHIAKQGYTTVDQAPDDVTRATNPRIVYFKIDEFGYDAVRTPMNLPISQAVLKAAARARTPIVKLPTMGGSVPLIMIERQLSVPTILTPIANHDNNQHSFNENIRLQNLWDGIELMAAF